MKRNRKELNQIHRNPLPVELSVDTRGELPLVNVTNGISWLWLWIRIATLYFTSPPRAPKMRISLEDPGVFALRSEGDMRRAWNNGFFGKGTLSRSEPTFGARVSGQLKSSEAVTSERRRKRREFKELRAQFQRLEAEQRKRELSLEEMQKMEELKVKMEEVNTEALTFKDNEETAGSEDLADLEFSQLDPVEAFFLAFALEAGEVSTEKSVLNDIELLRSIADLDHSQESFVHRLSAFLQRYVVYHHYRSLGWCVRSGIKFGCEYLLYKRGPPFHHAEFGILISAADESRSWEDTMAVARVIGGVKKTLIFAYVEMPTLEQVSEVWEGKKSPRQKVMDLLQLYRISEMVYRRWSPSRTRE
ncbi:tRNA-intron endonuclease [Candidozyma duobushaemuli]|nr:tRNA-intron endonuclease [[Candida] duobushaemulonis]PVH14104.1 tRNA-intron endonuclease [[Candida] duobushaemulonis]